jgi:DNA polymerase-1
MGDTSDNIPGVPGIGEKTALKYIAEYGSLDGLYEHLNDGAIKGAALTKLTEGKESAYLSQFLAAIKCDVPLGVTLESLSYGGIKRCELKPLLTELELTSMIKRLGLDKEEESAPSD